jgi:hypothetical protein
LLVVKPTTLISRIKNLGLKSRFSPMHECSGFVLRNFLHVCLASKQSLRAADIAHLQRKLSKAPQQVHNMELQLARAEALVETLPEPKSKL